METIPQSIKDRLEKTCMCRGTTTATVKDAIRNGNTTLEAVIEATGVTKGGCKGNRCKDKVRTLLSTYASGEWE